MPTHNENQTTHNKKNYLCINCYCMFSFFKPKTKLADLIPSSYVDIHSHVLPGIDDGAKTIEDSKFLLESMVNFGFSKIITSPHTIENIWNNTPETIAQALAVTKENLTTLADKVALKPLQNIF